MAKKDFSNAPAINTFISNNNDQIQPTIEEKKPLESEQIPPISEQQNSEKGFKFVAQEKPEIKDKRVQLVLTPTLYKKLKAKAKENKASMNELVCQLIDQML